jgi:hypothetical protein
LQDVGYRTVGLEVKVVLGLNIYQIPSRRKSLPATNWYDITDAFSSWVGTDDLYYLLASDQSCHILLNLTEALTKRETKVGHRWQVELVR